MLELGTPPAITARTQADVAAQSQRIRSEQAAVRQNLIAIGAQVLFQTSMAYNGIAVSIDASLIERLRKLPGVINVHIIPPKQRENVDAVSFIGAPMVWGAPWRRDRPRHSRRRDR